MQMLFRFHAFTQSLRPMGEGAPKVKTVQPTHNSFLFKQSKINNSNYTNLHYQIDSLKYFKETKIIEPGLKPANVFHWISLFESIP